MPKLANKLTPQKLEENVLARLAAGVEYGPEMQRARFEQNKMAYPNAPGPVDEDLDYKEHIAGIMAKLGRPMPAPAGSNYYYTQPQYEQAMQMLYPSDPIQHMLNQQEWARRFQTAPTVTSRGLPTNSTFAGGRDYAGEQGPPITASSNLNAMRASLYPYLQMLGLAR